MTDQNIRKKAIAAALAVLPPLSGVNDLLIQAEWIASYIASGQFPAARDEPAAQSLQEGL